jgi:ABC-type nitrate/sulfonate/bicarbonate transport system permease component
MKRNEQHYLLPLLGPTLLLGIWELLGRMASAREYVLPLPSRILEVAANNWGSLALESSVTLIEAGAALLLAFVP